MRSARGLFPCRASAVFWGPCPPSEGVHMCRVVSSPWAGSRAMPHCCTHAAVHAGRAAHQDCVQPQNPVQHALPGGGHGQVWQAGPPANPPAGCGNLLWAQVALHLSGWGTCLLTVTLPWCAAEEGGTRLRLLTEQTVADINRKRGANPPVCATAGAPHCPAPHRSAAQHSGAAAQLRSLRSDAPA